MSFFLIAEKRHQFRSVVPVIPRCFKAMKPSKPFFFLRSPYMLEIMLFGVLSLVFYSSGERVFFGMDIVTDSIVLSF